MARINFEHEGTKGIYQIITSENHLRPREQFEKFINVALFSLARRDDLYLEEIKSLSKNILDNYARVLALLFSMTEKDYLGDVFNATMSSGALGQFFTPEHISDFMAQIQSPEKIEKRECRDFVTVADNCCGSGRMLMSFFKIRKDAIFFAKDIDHLCVKMATINFAVRGMNAVVRWGNGLTDEVWKMYETGFDGKSFLRIIDVPQEEKKEDKKENIKTEKEVEQKIEKSGEAEVLMPVLQKTLF